MRGPNEQIGLTKYLCEARIHPVDHDGGNTLGMHLRCKMEHERMEGVGLGALHNHHKILLNVAKKRELQ